MSGHNLNSSSTPFLAGKMTAVITLQEKGYSVFCQFIWTGTHENNTNLMFTFTACAILLSILSYTIKFYIMGTNALSHKVQYNLYNYLSISLPIIPFSILVPFYFLLNLTSYFYRYSIKQGFFFIDSLNTLDFAFYRNSAKCVTLTLGTRWLLLVVLEFLLEQSLTQECISGWIKVLFYLFLSAAGDVGFEWAKTSYISAMAVGWRVISVRESYTQ